MPIIAKLPSSNLFSTLPSTPPPNIPRRHTSSPPKPPIPVPKYPPPPLKSQKHPPNPAFKTLHRNTKYHKPVKPGVISSDGDRAVVVGESGLSYLLPGAPFEFQFSYSETPKVKPVAIREPAFLPFAPPTMPRPWTGKAPMKNERRKARKIALVESMNPVAEEEGRVKRLEMVRPLEMGRFPVEVKPRQKVIGKPLTRAEIYELLKPHIGSNRQVNLGRDGLTHNMLELVHTHWKRRPVCKVRCLGVPTVDMNNVCRCLEEKTGGKIIHRVGGTVYIFRGRNYDHRTRPWYPVMLWKPATPVYPKLIQEAPEGLTKAEADELRKKGKNLLPICRLAKNGVYTALVKDVKNAFEGSPLVKINCERLEPSDYKKIGAKLKDLVPCVLLSFDNEQILMWRGQGWKSMYPEAPSASISADSDAANGFNFSGSRSDDYQKPDLKTVISSPKMMSLWQRAIETSKAMLLEDIGLGPDSLLQKVEEFDSMSQATEHSYPALVFSSEDGNSSHDDGSEEDEDDDEDFLSDPFERTESSVPIGSLPVDWIATQPDEQ
ncbi:hypothetical protein RHGRI_033454 [Rhododendron griersonianum]|uniref:CRM domain-containing protein n=1 Tax=Rhododendron griersonianum TaxID=479676 RepID=A0AAV6HX95_9ERIC|nr:hypothetical protein RHGRI_033454 [Rhododendron griersonianum]